MIRYLQEQGAISFRVVDPFIVRALYACFTALASAVSQRQAVFGIGNSCALILCSVAPTT
jgi:ABC-type uncharacterized transport system permease subunit